MVTDVRIGRTWPMPPGIRGTALFSVDHHYRHTLVRQWDSGKGCMVTIATNPSGASADRDDATIRILEGLAARQGKRSLVMLNAYDRISTDMAPIRRDWSTALSADNDAIIEDMLTIAKVAPDHVNIVLCAWGVIPAERDAALRRLVRVCGLPAFCLGTTREGFPFHPLRHQTRELFPFDA